MFRFALSLCVLCLLFGASIQADYSVPNVLVEALLPQGLRVSIPDEPGISLFAFHGKINQELYNREAGTFSVDIIKPKNGRWTYFNPNVQLNIGDIIYFWVNVDYDDGTGAGKRGYIQDDLSFTVDELVSADVGGTTTTTRRPTHATRTTRASRTTRTQRTTTENPNCQHTSTTVNGKHSCNGKIIFQDNFANLNAKKWKTEVRFAGEPDFEFVVYQNNSDNLYAEKNRLYIMPSLLEEKYGHGFVTNSVGINLGDGCTAVPESLDCHQKPKSFLILPPVISAQISTKDHFSFRYGVVEIRAKFPKGDWIYPELHLRSKHEEYGPGLGSGLIRIAFSPGNIDDSSKHLYGGCVLGESEAARNNALKSIYSEINWNEDFNVFKMEWKADGITLKVNEHTYGKIVPPEQGFAAEQTQLELEPETVEKWRTGGLFAPFDKEMYLTLGVGVGGQCFPNRDDGSKPWDNYDAKGLLNFYQAQNVWSKTWGDDSTLIVDYVKIWAL